MGSGVDRQQFRQEKLLPRTVDVRIVVRRLRVLTDSSSSPRIIDSWIVGMEGMSGGEFDKLIKGPGLKSGIVVPSRCLREEDCSS